MNWNDDKQTGPLTFGSLFAGIGGFDLGLERAGMIPLWQVEIDDYCNKVLAKHWPDVKRYRDVRECGKHNLEAVDLICGGFPCQDISQAGRKQGINGENSGLWSEFARIIGELRPRYAIVENVPALLIRGMETVCGNLASIGYDAEWQIIPASAFNLPHQRERLYIIAYANSIFYRQNNSKGQSRYFSKITIDIPKFNKFNYTPTVVRKTNGIPNRVDRFRALGNAVVPQVVEHIGNLILKVENELE